MSTASIRSTRRLQRGIHGVGRLFGGGITELWCCNTNCYLSVMAETQPLLIDTEEVSKELKQPLRATDCLDYEERS